MIHYTTNYGLAYVDIDTALVDLAAASQELAAAADAALTAGGITPPGASDLVNEIGARQAADNALDARLDALEAPPVLPYCQAHATAGQSVAHNTWTALNLPGETLDSSAMHDTATNNSRITITRKGVYRVTGATAWPSFTTTSRNGARLRLNGATVLPGAALVSAPSGTEYHAALPAQLLSLNVGDYLELQGLQQSGAAQLTQATAELRSFLAVECVRFLP